MKYKIFFLNVTDVVIFNLPPEEYFPICMPVPGRANNRMEIRDKNRLFLISHWTISTAAASQCPFIITRKLVAKELGSFFFKTPLSSYSGQLPPAYPHTLDRVRLPGSWQFVERATANRVAAQLPDGLYAAR